MMPDLLRSLIVITALTETLCLKLEIQPRQITTLPGRNGSVLCRTGGAPISYCRISLPRQQNALSLGPKTAAHKEYTYYGAGLDKGECGVNFLSITDKYHGIITCGVGTDVDSMEYTASMQVTVLRAPKRPVLNVDSHNLKEGDLINATCKVEGGRPAAAITWKLGETIIYSDQQVGDVIAADNVHTVTQNLTRRATWNDNGKELKCIAKHPALGNDSKNSLISKTLSVLYPPVFVNHPIKLYGFVIGENAEVAVDLSANPEPRVSWKIGDVIVEEGDQQNSGKYKAEKIVKLKSSPGKWKASLFINPISAEDLYKDYFLIAKNLEGERTYKIVLALTRLSFAAIIGIVVGSFAVLSVIAIGMIAWYNRKIFRKDSEEIKLKNNDPSATRDCVSYVSNNAEEEFVSETHTEKSVLPATVEVVNEAASEPEPAEDDLYVNSCYEHPE